MKCCLTENFLDETVVNTPRRPQREGSTQISAGHLYNSFSTGNRICTWIVLLVAEVDKFRIGVEDFGEVLQEKGSGKGTAVEADTRRKSGQTIVRKCAGSRRLFNFYTFQRQTTANTK